MSDAKGFLSHYRERVSEKQSWLLLFFACLVLVWLRSTIVVSDLNRNEVEHHVWEPFVWEFSSYASLVICLLVLVRLFKQFGWHGLRPGLKWPLHLVSSVVFSLCHVGLMVAFRIAVYGWMGGEYDFGEWWPEWWYEYKKDGVTYAVFWVLYYSIKSIHKPTQQPVKSVPQLMIKNHQGIRWVAYSDIISVESGGNYVYLHCGNDVISYRSTMTEMEELLTPHAFIRTHRSYLVNEAAIESLQLSGDPAELVLQGGKKVPVSRKYKPNLRALVQGKNKHA